MAAPIQRGYRTHLQKGWPGTMARAGTPFEVLLGRLYIPSSFTGVVKPGDAVKWNSAQNAFQQVANTDADRLEMVGMIERDVGTVVDTLPAPPAGANSDARIIYADGQHVRVAVMGTFFAIAGTALEFGDQVTFKADDHKWDKFTPVDLDRVVTTDSALGGSTSLTAANTTENDNVVSMLAMPRNTAICVDTDPVADGELAMLRLTGMIR